MSLEVSMYPVVSTQPPATGEVVDDAIMMTAPPPLTPPAYTGMPCLNPHHHMKRDDDPYKRREMWLQEMRGWLMLLATLAASVTYQAGLNPPGGFWQEDDDHGHVAGTPVLESKFTRRYKVFFYFNATAFVTSVVIIILLMNESFYHSEAKVEALEIIVVLDMAALMGAYIAGSTREVSDSIYIIVLAVFVFLYVVYTARLLPKLWDVALKLACLRKAAEQGAIPMPRSVIDRSISAPPP